MMFVWWKTLIALYLMGALAMATFLFLFTIFVIVYEGRNRRWGPILKTMALVVLLWPLTTLAFLIYYLAPLAEDFLEFLQDC
jgi:hypothetical protein